MQSYVENETKLFIHHSFGVQSVTDEISLVFSLIAKLTSKFHSLENRMRKGNKFEVTKFELEPQNVGSKNQAEKSGINFGN